MSIRANVDARRFDQRITFERRTDVVDEIGQPVPTWATLVECHAAVDAAKADSEPVLGSGAKLVMPCTFWIRADVFVRYSITMRDRIRWRGVIYDIGAAPDQQLRGRLIAILATTGLRDG